MGQSWFQGTFSSERLKKLLYDIGKIFWSIFFFKWSTLEQIRLNRIFSRCSIWKKIDWRVTWMLSRCQGDSHVTSQEVWLHRRRCSRNSFHSAAASFSNYCQFDVPTSVAWQRRSAVDCCYATALRLLIRLNVAYMVGQKSKPDYFCNNFAKPYKNWLAVDTYIL